MQRSLPALVVLSAHRARLPERGAAACRSRPSRLRPLPAAPASGSEPAPDPAAALAAKIDPIFAAYAQGHGPGCGVGVYRAGEVVFARGYGYADLEHDVLNTDTTVFYLASVSKQFTAAAVLLLAADGRLSLDDDVRKYIPELPDYGKRVTLRHLLHHTSGVRDYGLLVDLAGRDDEDAVTNDDVLALLSRQRGLNFPPGSRHLYSNSGYVLLSIVVERVSGTPFAAFVKARIFDPLGMSDSLVKQDHRRLVPRRAMGYVRRPDGTFGTAVSSSEYTGPGNVMTTLRDLGRWDANFYAPKVGGQALLDGLRTRGKLEDGTVLDYAMGLVHGDRSGVPYEWHNGAFVGYRTMLARYPGERLTVAVLCNDAAADPEKLSAEVADLFLPRPREPAAKTKAATPPPAAPLGMDPALLAGSYRDPATLEIRVVEPKDGVIRMRFALEGGPEARELVPVGPRELVVKGFDTRYAYEPAHGKVPAHLVRKSSEGPADTFVRFDPVSAVPPAKVAEYAGRYGSDESARDLQMVVKDGKLFIGSWAGPLAPVPLRPIAADVFLIGPLSVSFERDGRGKVKALVIETPRTRGVRLEKR